MRKLDSDALTALYFLACIVFIVWLAVSGFGPAGNESQEQERVEAKCGASCTASGCRERCSITCEVGKVAVCKDGKYQRNAFGGASDQCEYKPSCACRSA